MPRENGFDKDPRRASEAGAKSKRGVDLKTKLRQVLNERLPPQIFEKFKEQFGLEESMTQGEAVVRSVVLKMIERGESKQLIDILKITDEYTERVHYQRDDVPKHIHNLSKATLDKLGEVFTNEFAEAPLDSLNV